MRELSPGLMGAPWDPTELLWEPSRPGRPTSPATVESARTVSPSAPMVGTTSSAKVRGAMSVREQPPPRCLCDGAIHNVQCITAQQCITA